jgi:hypothetical protein
MLGFSAICLWKSVVLQDFSESRERDAANEQPCSHKALLLRTDVTDLLRPLSPFYALISRAMLFTVVSSSSPFSLAASSCA